MSNSTSSAFANRRPPAKTEKLGFLHLPKNVRKMIYELAIYDHDRGVVCLPRGTPRKQSTWYAPGLSFVGRLSGGFIGDVCGLSFDKGRARAGVDSAATGKWTDGDPVSLMTKGPVPDSDSEPESEPEDGTDHEIDVLTAAVKIEAEAEVEAEPNSEDEGCVDCAEEWELGSNDGDCPSECGCCCHDFLTEEAQDITTENYVAPPDRCVEGKCKDRRCEHCAGYGLGPDQLDPDYPDSEPELEEFVLEDAEDLDDAEHFDCDERIGVLFETKEPAILLACTEIRTQCLPMYYSQNAFSWRMHWLDYAGSLARFQCWVEDVVGDNVKHIGRLAFEGRHVVEEGVEFVAYTGMLHHDPGYAVIAGCLDVPTEVDNKITESLHGELDEKLACIASRPTSPPTFTVKDLCELGSIFVKAMHRNFEDTEPPRDMMPFGVSLGRVPASILQDEALLRRFLNFMPYEVLKKALTATQAQQPRPYHSRESSPELDGSISQLALSWVPPRGVSEEL
ncbi:hypothetical protein LTR56_022100 [Elasticomyces elasticus]|nr:hypothetical protein LTR56_022100 [Elasticomyces elasticus]KAK3629570.1 hypothetical protein LTR22_021847 [Elasticomyces elasticus]KAK4919735.1 hypothetical protein LTR49_012638 [Elasticomyces elasticus]KAK5758445.1 hypothetical protein LTS12_011467 [Elasticomyces elasticus]